MIRGWGKRDPEIRALFEGHYESLCRLAYLLLGDPSAAEEAVMDSYLKIVTAWHRISLMDRPDLYLRKAVLNQCTSRLRRRSVEARARHRLAITPSTDEPHVFEIDVWGAIVALPPRQRAAIVLRYYEDRSEAEIADLLQCSAGTVKSQLAKARQKLKVVLESADVEEA